MIDRILEPRRRADQRGTFELRGLAERKCPPGDTRSLAAAARRLAKAGGLSP